MYTPLSRISLLQGLSATEVEKIGILTQMFQTHKGQNVRIARQGESCNTMSLLVEGHLVRKLLSRKSDFHFLEYLPAPWILEPESLYGLNCTYTSGYFLAENSTLFTLTKKDMALIFSRNEIFRMNYLNTLSATLQRHIARKHEAFTPDMYKRTLAFICNLSLCQAGTKTLRIRMGDLADYVNETRLSVSRVLNDWQEAGLVELQRRELYIAKLEDLIAHVQS